jgi:uncharacterized protein with NRDE domain
MCIAFLSYKTLFDYPCILAFNRDEFYDREATQIELHDKFYYGTDLKAGGTWFGMDNPEQGNRWALLTNHRKPDLVDESLPSRGEIILNYLIQNESFAQYVTVLQNKRYNPYNLFVYEEDKLFYFNGLENKLHELEPGLYALSNGHLLEPWPKMKLGLNLLQQAQRERLICDLETILNNDQKFSNHQLPQTGIPVEAERMLSSIFIESPHYGTVSQSLYICSDKGWLLREKQVKSEKIVEYKGPR